MNNIEPRVAIEMVGEALYPGREDWKALLAHDLNVPTKTIREWQRGHTKFGAGHGAVWDMIRLCEDRSIKLQWAKLTLLKWRKSLEAA